VPTVLGKQSALLTPQQTWSSISASLPAPAVGRLPTAQAFGHALAEPILADRDLPPADRSAMDGFAVRAADLAGAPVTLTVIGEIAAGSAAALQVTPATCARIYTGANLPLGADTVVKLEDTRAVDPEHVTFGQPERAGANILRRGENARAGDELIPAGRVLGALHLAMCAAAGRTSVQVFRKARVAVIATGRELLGAADVVDTHQERDANGPLVTTAIATAGFTVAEVARVPDDRDAVLAGLRAALAGADAVVTSGGVSVGAYDFVPAAVTEAGARTLVHGVAMKPGKPFLFALAEGGKPVFGLPGNPLSAATGLYEFVLPALRRMAGWPETLCRPLLGARLAAPVASWPGRQRYVLAELSWTEAGPEVRPLPSQSSADLAAGARADGAIIVPADTRGLDAGAQVSFRPWRVWP
jgi:molybdopterin molybdotransferase